MTIASGLAAFSFPVFMGGVGRDPGRPVLPRGLDPEALGAAMLAQVEKRLALWSGIGLVVLIALIVMLKLL